MAPGRVWSLRRRVAGLRARPQGGEEGGMRAREGRRGRARRLEAKGGRDGEGPVGGGPQGEALELDGETERNSQPPTSSQALRQRVLNVLLMSVSSLRAKLC